MRLSGPSAVVFAAVMLGTVPAARAQAPRLVRGLVLATDSTPLADAMIAPLGAGVSPATSGPSGRFAIRLPAGADRLVGARIGFAPETLQVAAGTVVFRLRQSAVTLDSIVVAADLAFSTASSRVIRALDIRLRPRESSQELLRLTPGLVIAQHAGGGKAEQIFLRGFDADHGTDVAISVDGTPVNMVSHAHGQGYADLHFSYSGGRGRDRRAEGPLRRADGDLATAGAVAFRTKDRIGRGQVETRGGSFNTVHGLALVPFGGDAARAGGYLAASAHYTRGPFVASQDYRRINLFGKWTTPLGGGVSLVATASGFDSRWNGSGQVPARAVADGLISRFGSIDATEGGKTYRYDASLVLRGSAGEGAWDLRAYGVRYQLDLFSDFTFFLVDSVSGDGIEQYDRRTIGGLQGRYATATRLFGLGGRTAAGFDLRGDFGDIALYHQGGSHPARDPRAGRPLRAALQRLGEAGFQALAAPAPRAWPPG